MLRMGRSPRVEPAEGERPNAAPQPPQTYGAPPTPQPTAAPRAAEYAEAPPAARPEVARPSTPRAVSETEALARDLKEGVVSGFVGNGTVLNGDAEFRGMLRVDGHITGRITSEKGTLIVSAGGRVDANVRVGTAKVNGVINGDVVASERIELGRSAQVHGNIQTPSLVVEQGAIFEGACRMTSAAPAQAAVERASVAPAANAQQQTRPTQPLKPRPAPALPVAAKAPTPVPEAAAAPPK